MAPFGTTPERANNSETDDVSSSDSLDESLMMVYRRRELVVADGPERIIEETTAAGDPERSVDETAANGPERSDEEKKVNSSRKRGSEEVIESGKICHNCRNRHVDYLPCSRCSLRFCSRCLRNRHGEDIEVEQGENVRWVCPRCRGGCGAGCFTNCCNCSSCRKSQHLAPTGQMHKIAIDHGFNNVHDYLIHMETGESAAAIARRKEGRGWTSVDSGILSDVRRQRKIVRKIVRKSSASQKEQKVFSGEQMESKLPFCETADQIVPQKETTHRYTFPEEDIEEKWTDLPRDDLTFRRQLAGACFDSYNSRFL